MGSRKEKKLKDFLISVRKRHSAKLSDAPIWVIQRANQRFYNPHQKRNWRETHLALAFHNQKRKKKKKGKQ